MRELELGRLLGLARVLLVGPPVEEPGPPRAGSSRLADRIALGSVLIGGLLAAILVAGRFAFSGSEVHVSGDVLGLAATSQPVRVQAGAQASPVSAASPAAAASPTPRPTSASNSTELAHITNTDGQGVVLRASPREDDRTPRGFLDGDAVTVLERSGREWARVRGDNGQEGWVPTRYLGP